MSADLYQPHPLFEIDSIRYDVSYSMPKDHYHHAYELYILEEGEHEILIEDAIYHVSAYDAAMFKPNRFHRSRRQDACTRTCVYFTERYLHMHYTERSIRLLLACFDTPIIPLSREVFPRVKRLLTLMAQEDVESEDSRIFVYLAELLMILNDHRQASPAKPKIRPKQEGIAAILSYINQNFNRINKIEEIAERFYLSKYHLCRTFKEATGLTIIQYLNHIKIQHACQLLLNTDLSVTEVGAACGFHSTMYFCKVFKQATAMTPTEFRRSGS